MRCRLCQWFCLGLVASALGCGYYAKKTPAPASSVAQRPTDPPTPPPSQPPVNPMAKPPSAPKAPDKAPPSPADVPVTKEEEEELKRFQGTWILTKLEDGSTPNPGQPVDGQLIIQGNRYAFRHEGTTARGTLRLRPEKNPKEIDAFLQNPQTGAESLLPGIYEIDGDVQRSIFAAGGGPRPRTFKVEPGAGYRLYIFKHQKPADAPKEPK